MTSSLLTKVGIATLSVGGVGVVGWQINNYLNKEIKTDSYLSKQKRERAYSDGDWQKIKGFYASAENSELIPNVSVANVKLEDIKIWCDKELDKPLKEQSENNLELIETWCSKPKALSEQIISLGKVVLNVDTESSTNPHKGKWDSNAESYKTAGDKFKIKKKDSSSTNWVDFQANEATGDIMKEWCKDKKDKQYKHSGDLLFKTYLKWCSQ